MRQMLKVVAFGVLTLGFVPSAQAETLADALIAAYRHSNLLEQNQAVLRASDEDAAMAVSALRPVISYVSSVGSSYTQSASHRQRSVFDPTLVESTSFGKSFRAAFELSLSLTLMDFGRRSLAIDVARENVLATRQSLIAVEQQVLLAAVAAYVDVRLQGEIVALRSANLRLIAQELTAARDRFAVGEITRTDVSIAEAALAASQARLAAAKGDLDVARETYRAAVGAYPGRLSALPNRPALSQTAAAARDVAVRSHPSIRQSQHMVRISDLNIQLAEAAMQPTLGLTAGLSASRGESDGLIGDSQATGGSVGLRLSQTLYAGGQLSAQYRKAVAQQEGARAALRQSVLMVEQNIGTLWAMLQVYTASIAASRQQILAAEAAFEGVRQEAALGARTTLDVLNAEQDLLDARAAKLEAEASRYIAVYQLLSAMGLLTAEHLNLGIPTYDPQAYSEAVKNAPATSVQGKKLDRILRRN